MKTHIVKLTQEQREHLEQLIGRGNAPVDVPVDVPDTSIA